MYKFLHDWFTPNLENLTNIFSGYSAKNPPNILEIGAFEGRSTVWFLECVPGCTITTIDTWGGGTDHAPDNPDINFVQVQEHFEHNMSHFPGRVRAIKDSSYNALVRLIEAGERFDFAFIDGSHTAIDVNLDLILSFKLLHIGGVLYADDYLWGFTDKSIYESPKLGIDSFVNVYANKLRPLKALSNQAAVYVKRSE